MAPFVAGIAPTQPSPVEGEGASFPPLCGSLCGGGSILRVVIVGTAVWLLTFGGAALGAGTAGAPWSAAVPSTVEAADLRQQGGSTEEYIDDRSTATQLVRSYFNAINRREYARAYSYWESGPA